jgi:hypothetical protein
MSSSSKPVILCLAILFLSFLHLFAIDHPHIIVRKSDYDSLQAKARTFPWSSIKAKAKNVALNLDINGNESLGKLCTRVHDMASALALTYILEPESRPAIVAKTETQLLDAIDKISTLKGDETDHGHNVAPAHAAFMMYLLLDILYDDLDFISRYVIEAACDAIATGHTSSWFSSAYAIKGMRVLYHKGPVQQFEYYKDLYKDYILDLTTEDGVYTTGPGYTKSRLFMDNRMQKKIFMDICEYQGYHEFYSNAKLQRLTEWVMGYTMTPFNRSFTFGDTPPTKSLNEWSVAALRAKRFTRRAQAFASYQLGPLTEQNTTGGLLHYLLCDSLPVLPERPRSNAFPNGGAWFFEDSDSDRALAGALWNSDTENKSHNHFDVNAIHVAAYGEHVLRNSGYSGSGKPDPGRWTWLHYTAESSNTLMLSHKNHQSWRGGGVSDPLFDNVMDYACGNSGNALVLATHQRNFIYIKPHSGVSPGYFITIDDVQAGFIWSKTEPVSIAWHPNSRSMPEVSSDHTEYRWPIQGCNYSGHPVGVSLFLATPCKELDMRTGYLGSYSDCSAFDAPYLYATYELENSHACIVTGIFPYDDTQPVPHPRRLLLENGQGMIVEHKQGIEDIVLSAPHPSTLQYDSIDAHGLSALWRQLDQSVEWFFLRQGTSFLYNDSREGIVAEHPLTMISRASHGQFITPSNRITFYQPAIKSISLQGLATRVVDYGENWMTIKVDSGHYEYTLETGSTRVNSLSSEQAGRQLELGPNYPNPFNADTQLHYQLPHSGHVVLAIYNLKGQRIATLVDEFQNAGQYIIPFRARHLSSGLYFARLQSHGRVTVQKLLLQK